MWPSVDWLIFSIFGRLNDAALNDYLIWSGDRNKIRKQLKVDWPIEQNLRRLGFEIHEFVQMFVLQTVFVICIHVFFL